MSLRLISLGCALIFVRMFAVHARAAEPPEPPGEQPRQEPHEIRGLGTVPWGDLWNENWEKDRPEIPFYIASGDFTNAQRRNIIAALEDLEARSGVVNFRWWRETDDEYIYIKESSSGCSASKEKVWLESWCADNIGNIQHEILHALGFWHEQNRPDRNDWVQIKWNNIQDGWDSQFYMYDTIDSLGAPYDYDSVMHYSAWAVSKNGKKTIKPLHARAGRLGQRVQASELDIVQMRLLYQCSTGPRNYTLYKAESCTDDCKCGLEMTRCDGDDSMCKGDLICRNDTCVAPATPDVCEDDIEFRFKYIGWKHCRWVSENVEKRCAKSSIAEGCPSTCGLC